MTENWQKSAVRPWRTHLTYDDWMECRDAPVHRGYHIADLRNIELGWWEPGGWKMAFTRTVGQ